jgi:hypothetical protein
MSTPAKNKSSVAASTNSPVRHRASLESDKELSELTGQEPEACTSPMIKARSDRQGLDERVWTVPVSKVAEEFGVSDGGMGKICKRLCISVPGRGYWAKNAANRSVKPRPASTPLCEADPTAARD